MKVQAKLQGGPNIRVKVKQGWVEGKPGKLPGTTAFLGIPFARSPVGELRYAAPQPPESWEGIRDCSEFQSSCIQPQRGETFPVSEDCLYLNVYTPAQSSENRLPVMIWIHGGGFNGGRTDTPVLDGAEINRRGVVLVTINYRCGVMGFCALPGWEHGVNAGILDQIAALRWVRENIAAFGGDPDNITIFGQSAGGMSVRMLLTSPLTNGLFQRAIVQSGGGLNEADPIRQKNAFMQLCKRAMDHLGWTEEDLMQRDAMEITEAMNMAARACADTFEVGYFQPFIDGYSITDVPGVLIARGQYQDVPIMCGTVAGDSWMFSRKVRNQLADAAHFRGFSYAASQAWAQLTLQSGRTQIYTYYMDRKQPAVPNSHHHNGPPPYGAETPHTSDVAYVFGHRDIVGLPSEPIDVELSQQMCSYWCNFAKHGNPNGEGLEYWPINVAMHFGDHGCRAENIIMTSREQQTLDYTIAHPGLLTSLEGFDA